MKRKIIKCIALFLSFNLLFEIAFPTIAYALTAGPDSPEFSSFEPVATTDMVNLFSGEFNYNLPVIEIPGPDGAGYALSLSYHSGTSSEEEASWVGYGWTLNPGAINRSVRGFPDDYKAQQVKYYNKSFPNYSASVTTAAALEFFSKQEIKESERNPAVVGNNLFTLKFDDNLFAPPTIRDSTGESTNQRYTDLLGSFSANSTLRFNNYQGFSRYYGLGINAKGMANLDVNTSAEGTTFNAGINVYEILQATRKKPGEKNEDPKEDNGKTEQETKKTESKRIYTNLSGVWAKAIQQYNSSYLSTYGIHAKSEEVRSVAIPRYARSRSFNYSLGAEFNPGNIPVGINTNTRGNFNFHSLEATYEMNTHGYMHNPNHIGDNTMSDYYVEKNTPFQKRDLYLGIPFNNADQFIVTGEGLGGAFRFYPRSIGHFYPNSVKNTMRIGQLGFDLSYGSAVGIGVSFGLGSQKTIVDKWNRLGNTNDFKFNNEGYFRFNNDMGGSVSYAGSDLLTARLDVGFKRKPIIPLDSIALDKLYGASSYIAYKKAGDTDHFNKNLELPQVIDDNIITELSVHNSDGLQYIYGQPVFNRNETNLQFSIPEGASTENHYLSYTGSTPLPLRKINGQYEVDTDASDSDSYRTISGEIRQSPYATNYLITQILSHDYIDLGGKGCDQQDFGSWTQFLYFKKYGYNASNWYRWRSPYQGLSYSQNSISDTRDDLGGVFTGEKEVHYLKAIETKSHIAFFVTNDANEERWQDEINAIIEEYYDPAKTNTAELRATLNSYLVGSGNPRLDGLSAADLTSTEDPASRNDDNHGNLRLEKLEKIVLFSKNRLDKPIKTVRLEYDYGLVKRLPNNSNPASGKLTLKKVWFEYEGIVNAKISPYKFIYNYPDVNEFSKHIQEKYPEATFQDKQFLEENPNYAPHLLDPWGNLQVDGLKRKKVGIPWINQGANQDDFDPAAWQLKQIMLPSGGKILIEYEQKDYAYVQDRTPMAMTSLLKAYDFPPINSLPIHPIYIVNVRDLGIDPSNVEEVLQQVDKLKTYFSEEKMYFKFLYQLIGENEREVDLNDCHSEYIDGYTAVNTSKIDTVSIDGAYHISITLNGTDDNSGFRTTVPRQACYEFYSTQRMGKLNGSDCITDLEAKFDQSIAALAGQNTGGNNSNTRGLFRSTVVDLVTDMYGRFIRFGEFGIPDKVNVCRKMKPDLSFLKLPMLKAKKGGGVRVKRLLMYDSGLEDGKTDAALYGQEYHYEDIDDDGNVISSGVAANEPKLAREENPLVTFLPRRRQRQYSRITAGKDKKQTEGPIGESILPGASIGHSRVVVENIHKGVTGTGFTIHQFHTVKDYPFDKLYQVTKPDLNNGEGTSDLTDVSDEGFVAGITHSHIGENFDDSKFTIPAGLFYFDMNRVWMTQGYRFIQNSMHGQIKAVSSYAGNYQAHKLHLLKKISSQEYHYYEPGEKIKMLKPDGTWYYDIPGKEMDIAMEMKAVKEKTLDIGIDVDIHLGIATPLPVTVSTALNFNLSNTGTSTHVISKVIRYPTIVKKVTSFQDGVTSLTENLAFDPNTGQTVLTRTYDGFHKIKDGNQTHDGSIYSLNLPASWYYPSMGPKTENSQNTNQLTAFTASITSYGASGNPLISDSTKNWNTQPIKNVVNATLQTFDNEWYNNSQIKDELDRDYSVSDPAKAKLDNIWRPKISYVYRDDTKSANEANGRIYKDGLISSINLPPIDNWDNITDSKWLLSNRITEYSPNGNPVEEVNILNIPSAARYGYHNMLPVMTAANAKYINIGFEDFETVNDNRVTSSTAHSGAQSMIIDGTNQNILTNLKNDERLKHPRDGGAIVNLWINTREQAVFQMLLNNNENSAVDLELIARTGEWALYEGIFPPYVFNAFGNAQDLTLSVRTKDSQALQMAYLDDVKFQPKNAQATCYVYDVTTLRLLAQFDDQHFALFYQYDSEGKLIRKLIETERGIKTVTETQYNVTKKARKP